MLQLQSPSGTLYDIDATLNAKERDTHIDVRIAGASEFFTVRKADVFEDGEPLSFATAPSSGPTFRSGKRFGGLSLGRGGYVA